MLAAELVGTPYADTLRGDAARNVLDGAGGDDLLVGRAGAELLIGGAGIDTVSYASSPEGVTVSLVGPLSGGDAEGDAISGGLLGESSERLEGSAHDDALEGDEEANVLTGDGGRDRLSGRGGDDLLAARDGGPDDIACGDGADSVTADLLRVDAIAADCETVDALVQPLTEPPAPEPVPAGEPAPVSGPAFVADAVASTLVRVSLLRRTFRVGRAPTPVSARRTPAGTAFRFTLSEPATVRIVLERTAAGRGSVRFSGRISRCPPAATAPRSSRPTPAATARRRAA